MCIARVYGLNEIQAGEMLEFGSGVCTHVCMPNKHTYIYKSIQNVLENVS